jgi:cobalt-zinc-cadmium efflux system outer membrane protein
MRGKGASGETQNRSGRHGPIRKGHGRMKNAFKSLCTSVLFASVATGCASPPQQAGFGEVRDAVAERTGQPVHWNRGGPEDEAAAEAVRAMLSEELSRETAVQIALLNNRRLQATYEELGLAQAALVQAGLLKNPIFAGAIRFPLSDGSAELDFSIVQDFLNILYTPLRKRVAASEFEAAKLRVTGDVIDLTGRTEAAYYRLLADEQTLEMRHQVVEAGSASFEAMKRLHEAGNVTVLDVDTERALYEQARLDLARAEAAVIESRERLNRLMGVWGAETQWTTARRLPEVPAEEPDLDDLESRAVAASIDLGIARQELVSFGERLGLVKATALVPALEAGVTSEREEREWEVGPAIALPVPLLDQGQARIAAAESDLRRRQQAYTALAVEVRSAVRAARQRLLTARNTARHYRDVMLPLAERVVAQTQLRYNAMQVGVFQLLLAKRQQILAAQRYIEALRDFWLARTELEQILRGRLTDLGLTPEPMTAMPDGGGLAPNEGGE